MGGRIVKVLSVLVTLQGLGYFIQSILGLYRGTELKIGVQLINSNYNIVGIILGAWLIFTGIGIWYRKGYAYSSTIIAYSLLIIYGISSVGYILVTQRINSDIITPIVLAIIVLVLFFMVIRYVQKNKLKFR
jgi:hypothetical protein